MLGGQEVLVLVEWEERLRPGDKHLWRWVSHLPRDRTRVYEDGWVQWEMMSPLL